MGEVLKKRLQMTRMAGPGQEAILNLLVAAGHLRERMDRVCEAHRITSGQYNVLRILRGARPDGFARCEISRRMVERAPDVTRLIDRLEAQDLVERDRSSEDRRRSVAKITDKGLRLLERMQPEFEALDRYIEQRLAVRDRRELSRILERLYTDEE
jgi:DNA-binding MarR family transcriptional regulator